MQRFEVEFKTVNAAFEQPNEEVARILREIADKVMAGDLSGGGIYDINGNPLGGWFVYD